MPELRVALCITDLEVGGAERCLAELAIRLDRRRFSPVVYCLAAAPEPRASLVPLLEAGRIEVRCLEARGTWDFFGAVGRLSRMLAAEKTDVVQTFLFHANIIGRIAARRAGVPWVLSGIRVAQRPARWRLWLDRLTEGLVDRHVSVSESVARFARREAGLAAEKLVVIPNGVDLERFSNPQPVAGDCPDFRGHHASRGRQNGTVPFMADRRLVAFIGRLDRQKGVAWLLDTAADWLPQLPGTDLLLVGKGPLERRLAGRCRRLGIDGRVHFLGWRPDIPAILAASRLLVLPSAWEGMPNVVLEAMASRLPVVATDVEGVGELLGPAAAEQTVPIGDSEAFSAKVIRFMEDSAAADSVGQANRVRAEQNFSIEQMVTAYQRLWESLAAGRN